MRSKTVIKRIQPNYMYICTHKNASYKYIQQHYKIVNKNVMHNP